MKIVAMVASASALLAAGFGLGSGVPAGAVAWRALAAGAAGAVVGAAAALLRPRPPKTTMAPPSEAK